VFILLEVLEILVLLVRQVLQERQVPLGKLALLVRQAKEVLEQHLLG
jgi:hypothetical protein